MPTLGPQIARLSLWMNPMFQVRASVLSALEKQLKALEQLLARIEKSLETPAT